MILSGWWGSTPQGPERLQVFHMLIKTLPPSHDLEFQLCFLSGWGPLKPPGIIRRDWRLFLSFPATLLQKGVLLFPPSPPFPPRPCMTSRHQMLMKVCQASRAVKWKLKILHYRMALKILSHETSPSSSSSPAPSSMQQKLSLPNKLWTKFAQ